MSNVSGHTSTLVVLDQDDATLATVSRICGPYARVIRVHDPMRAMALLDTEPGIDVFVTEQVLRGADGVQLLATVRTLRPAIRRVMLTDYAELSSIVTGLHSGAVEHLVQKPINPIELLHAIGIGVARQSTATPARASA